MPHHHFPTHHTSDIFPRVPSLQHVTDKVSSHLCVLLNVWGTKWQFAAQFLVRQSTAGNGQWSVKCSIGLRRGGDRLSVAQHGRDRGSYI